METVCDHRLLHSAFSSPTEESIHNGQELSTLRLRLIESKHSRLRLQWRSAAGFTLARYYRAQLLKLLLNQNYKLSNDQGGMIDQSNFLSPRILDRPTNTNVQYTSDLISLQHQLREQIQLTRTVKNAAEQEINCLKSLLAAESGNFASTVHALEERHCTIQHNLMEELTKTQRALSMMMQQYTSVKQSFTQMEYRLAQLGQRDADNRLVLERMVNRLTKLSSEKQILFDRLGELESRLAWSTPSTLQPPLTDFGFDQLNPAHVEADPDPSSRDSRLVDLHTRLSTLEHQIDQLQKTSESLSDYMRSSVPQGKGVLAKAALDPSVESTPNSSAFLPTDLVPIHLSHLRTIDSSAASTPEPVSSSTNQERMLCDGSNDPVNLDTSKVADLRNSRSCTSHQESKSPISKPNLLPNGVGSLVSRHNAVRCSNRVLLTGLGQTHAPRFCRLEMHHGPEPVVNLTTPVVYHHPATLCAQTVDSVGLHATCTVASIQPKIIKHKRYEMDALGSRAPCFNFESEDLSPDASIEGEDATAHSHEITETELQAKDVIESQEPVPSITPTYHPRLSKLGSVLKSIKRGKTE